ncbi:MAG: TorF family putative porin [Gammaproteobacteria bacterium]|nr:TorF family putative porin [Gammaproteobacteria bacterium]
MKKSLGLLVLVWLFAWMPHANAEEIEISANVTLASDYSFRGWSQTTRDPAIQGGFDIEFDEGFSLGTWASNVNFGASTTMEWDLYAGYSSSFNDDVSWSVSFIRFEYPSEGEALDYIEFGGSVSYMSFTAGLMLSPSYLGEDGPSFQYPYVDYSKELNDEVTLDLHAGISMVDEDDFFGDGNDSYIDFSASLTRSFHGIDVSAAIVGTNLDDNPDTEPRLVVSFSKSM